MVFAVSLFIVDVSLHNTPSEELSFVDYYITQPCVSTNTLFR